MKQLLLASYKTASQYPIVKAPIAEQLYFPITDHHVLVKPGEYVTTGQCLALPDNDKATAIHASSSGSLQGIMPYGHTPCITLHTDGKDECYPQYPIMDYKKLSPQTLIEKIQAAGIIGLGGAGFNSALKIKSAQKPQQLIINGVECEPYICADDSLMQTKSAEIIRGVEILCYILGLSTATIAIEHDKSLALQALMAEYSTTITIIPVPTYYPAGSERQLIAFINRQEIPSQYYPSDIGIICLNVATVVAIYRAITYDEPLISRITTLAGDAINQPRNYEVRIGTPLLDLLKFAGIDNDKLLHLSQGGPMMPSLLPHAKMPLLKTTNCILASYQAPAHTTEMPCIRCGDCNTVCPMHLQPVSLYWHAKHQQDEALERAHLFDCIECGCCDYVCPSHIPLTDYYQQAKQRLKQQHTEKARAELAKERFNNRQARLARTIHTTSPLIPAAISQEDKRQAIQLVMAKAKQKREQEQSGE